MRSTIALGLLSAAAVTAGLLAVRQQRQTPPRPSSGERVHSGHAKPEVLLVSPDRIRAAGY